MTPQASANSKGFRIESPASEMAGSSARAASQQSHSQLSTADAQSDSSQQHDAFYNGLLRAYGKGPAKP